METNFTPEYSKPDPNSIKTTTLLSFVAFAIILIVIVWSLTTFFVNRYYASVRSQEAVRIASDVTEQYRKFPSRFGDYAVRIASSNGVYIRLDTPGEQLVFDGMSRLEDNGTFGEDIKKINSALESSKSPEASLIMKSSNSDSKSRLVYATRIAPWSESNILYIIVPLYPDQATINVIRNLLVYVSAIVLIIAIILAFYLSRRLTKPIESITNSAQELSRGNYSVKFNGGGFTETKELAKTLNQASYEMEKTEFYQREIIANVSHDLKTPLTMIRGYAEKIIDISGDNPEKRNSDLNIIISETERLNKLVTDMMTVSNLQSNKIALNKEVFNFVEAAEDVFQSFLVLNSSNDFEVMFHPCRSTYVMGDKNKIMQVMSNFVSNAVKYSGDNKFVDIQLKRTGKKVVFHCIDHGLGIPKDEQQHVWDRYYRTSANHERDIEGTGLGLSIVKGILTLHNASYGVTSEEGKGSDFWFEMEAVKKPNDKSSDNKTGSVTIKLPGDDNGKES